MASSLGPMTSHDEQARCLADAVAAVKKNAYFMRKATDGDNLKDALRYAAALLGELRTGELQPHRYFELYMQVFDHLALLQSWISEQAAKGRVLGELYERVQWAGNVLPRLYLLCAVGAVYIRSREAPAKDILRDLVEMCKGVQHPVRGLFLRAYLCQAVRGLLPDAAPEAADAAGSSDGAALADAGDTGDALEFLLQNFTEMNKLWVRMQHQGGTRAQERAAREKERQQLADLVGRNLTYVSQLDGLDFARYSEVVLPRVLEQVVGCRDDIAQQYLMQALIQGFPDEFHLGTLDALLGAVPQLQPGVRLASVMASLMDRLARFVASGDAAVRGQLEQADAFGQLKAAAAKIAEAHSEMPVSDLAAIHIGLARFAGAVYPDDLEHVDAVLAACTEALAERDMSDPRGEQRVVDLLAVPLETYDVVTVLGLASYPPLMARLTRGRRREMALTVVRVVLKGDTKVENVDQVERLFDFISPLVKDMDQGAEEPDDEDFADEQGQVARLVHRLASPDPATQFAILQAARKRFAEGGPRRAGHVLAPLAAAALRLVRSLCRGGNAAGSGDAPTAQSVLQFTHGALCDLADVPGRANAALGLLLAAATAASQEARLQLIAYEFFEQAFTLYEEAVPDSKSEVAALHSIIGALHACRIFDDDSRGALAHKATGFSAKLLKRGDQCRAVLACAHLFWQPEDTIGAGPAAASEANEPATPPPSPAEAEDADSSQQEAGMAAEEAASAAQPAAAAISGEGADELQPPVRDAEAVMVCLKRALKLANAAQQQAAVAARAANLSAPAWLFVDILNAYAAHHAAGNPNITPGVLQDLQELVATEVSGEACQKDADLQRYHAASVVHLERVQQGYPSSK